jgi:glucose-6-phosphate dehydrogenase assembly protein OpcA
MASTRNTLDEARACERVAALAREKEKIITRHLEQQLATAQSIMIPQEDDDDRSVNTGSNPNTTLAVHLHVQAVGLPNIRSMVTFILKPSSPHYKWWCDLVLLTLHRYALDDHILSDIIDLLVY